MNVPPVEPYLAELRSDVEAALVRVLERLASPDVIAAPVRYALLGPGKRLRPCLTLAVADTIGEQLGTPRPIARALARPAACAIEMVHTYSLVHDDLPAMDNDALRRGRPTTHVVHGDGLAILAGDGLLTDAFLVLASCPSPADDGTEAPPIDPSRRLRALETLAEAAGTRGMVGGQAIDLAAVGIAGPAATPIGGAPELAAPVRLDADRLRDMHARKTGALIRASSTLGAIVTGADVATVQAIDRYAAELGLAFQIVDDVLDVEGSAAALGKTAGKDAAAGKPTFPALYGVDESKRLAAACIERAHAALDRAALGGRLRDIATWSLQRTS